MKLLAFIFEQPSYRTLTKEILVKYRFLGPQDMSLAENVNQAVLSVAGEHDSSFLYSIYKVIICNFILNVTYLIDIYQ